MLEEGLRKRLKSYIEKTSGYVIQKTNRDRKAEVALLALTILDLHLSMNPVLAPECPEDYLAQFEALREVLNDVVGFINSDKFTEDTGRELIAALLARLKHFTEFIGHCYGFELHVQLEAPGEEDLVFDVNVSEPQPNLSANKPWEEHTNELNKVFKGYHDQLIDYIYRKSGQDWRIPLALMALSMAELHVTMADLLSDRCPNYIKAHLEDIEMILGNLVKFLRGTVKPREDVRTWFALAIAFRLKFFLEFLAWCNGAELELKVEPVGGHIHISVVKYESLSPQGS
jgi:hypothetical protein